MLPLSPLVTKHMEGQGLDFPATGSPALSRVLRHGYSADTERMNGQIDQVSALDICA